MRKLIGGLVLIAGVGGLGYVAWAGHAPRMQAAIGVSAQSLAATAPHDLQTQVSGRDVIVTGRVTDQAEFDVLRAAIEDIQGVRVLDMSGVETLSVADPFELTASRDSDGAMILAGVVPSDADRAILGGSTMALSLAAGVPDGAWTSAASLGIEALERLKSGDLIVSDRALTLTGLAGTPDQSIAARAILDGLPDGYSYTAQIDVEDDGTPLRLNLTLRDGAVSASGKFPADLSPDVIGGLFVLRVPLDVSQAMIPAQNPDWHRLLRVSMGAASEMIEADLIINDNSVTLTGTGSPNGIARAKSALSQIPDTYDVTIDIAVWDDGAPLEMSMEWDGTSANASGKLPADFTLRGPAGVTVTRDARISFLPDEVGAFTTNANVGVAALGVLSAGSLAVTQSTITLTGTAASPQVGVVIDSILAGAAPNTEVDRDVAYLDDGSPAAWTLTYSAVDGAEISGRLPTRLDRDAIATALGLATAQGTPSVAVQDDDAGSSLDTLAIAAHYLPEVETLIYTHDGAGSALDLILSPGVDLDLVAVDLAEQLPPDVSFSLGPLDDLPSEGTMRTNSATNLDEVFTQGFWLPDLTFDTTVQGCTAASDAILASAKITFLSGSARLDATSIRAINGLTAVVRPCLDAGLRLEIDGHTDATGDASANEKLSYDRAAAVRIGLIERGVSDRLMSSLGFGQFDPIADNATAEGRAENRRTTLTWSQISPASDGAPAADQ